MTFKEAVPAILGGMDTIGQYVTQGIKARHERQRDERQFAHAKEMSEYAYSKDLEQWERSNLYNAPVSQMARFREAGLNPRLIYGQSGGGNIAAAQMPKYQAPRPDYRYSSPVTQIGGALQTYQNVMRSNAEIDLIKAQAQKLQADAATAGERAKYAPTYMQYQSTLMRNTSQSKAFDLGVKAGFGTFIDRHGNRHRFADMPGAKRYALELENMRIRNEVMNEQIKWMGLNGYGRIAKDALNILLRGYGKIGRAAAAGASGKFKKGGDYINKLNKWKKNKIFDDYVPKEF